MKHRATNKFSVTDSTVRMQLKVPSYSKTNMTMTLSQYVIKLRNYSPLMEIELLEDMTAYVTPSSISMVTSRARQPALMDPFNRSSPAMELINAVKDFVANYNSGDNGRNSRKSSKTSYTWGSVDAEGFAAFLISVCHSVREQFMAESRLLELSSPIHVLGDLHGNLPDLLGMESILWYLGPHICPNSLLFLGDYVDRGPHGVEVIAYLFAMKVINPRKVFLLRGNHEIREVQKMFTFFGECLIKFSDGLGRELWSAINCAFDAMPIAAVIDDKVFCCHGGIPPPWLCPVISAINDIPQPMPNPDEQSQLAWELMWNDPVRNVRLSESMTLEFAASEGFAVNVRRGTAHIFSAQALDRFLQVNQLTHIIRAHEVQQNGVSVQFGGKLITVFSSSHYCGGNNQAACVFIDNNEMTFIRNDP